jgi:hypothetical protein
VECVVYQDRFSRKLRDFASAGKNTTRGSQMDVQENQIVESVL